MKAGADSMDVSYNNIHAKLAAAGEFFGDEFSKQAATFCREASKSFELTAPGGDARCLPAT